MAGELTLERLSGRRILVTGGRGFIGSHLRRRLLELGAHVFATTRSSVDGDGDWIRVDLSDLETVRSAFAAVRPEIVCHLAAHVAGARGIERVPDTLQDGLVSAVNVFTAAQEVGSERVVFAGSMEAPAGVDPAVPSSPYAAAKWAASGYARMFWALYGLPVVTLRVFMVYGPGQKDEQKLVPYTALSLLRGETPRLSSGARAVDWVYIDDVVDAFVRAACADGVGGEELEVGSGTSVTVREVVERLVALANPGITPEFGAVADRPLETSPVADLSRAQAVLGWRPVTGLDEGLRRTVEWYRTRLSGG